MATQSMFEKRAVEFSPCRRYRYFLSVTWDADKPAVNFLMLNPSTADEQKNDPTIERCQRRATMLGFGSLLITNLFAYRSTDPTALSMRELLPSGPVDHLDGLNDAWITETAEKADMVICGWGKHGSLFGRDAQVKRLLSESEAACYALIVNDDGSPRHPLYIGYDVEPVAFELGDRA